IMGYENIRQINRYLFFSTYKSMAYDRYLIVSVILDMMIYDAALRSGFAWLSIIKSIMNINLQLSLDVRFLYFAQALVYALDVQQEIQSSV
ncbi:hypothetical protein, partial [Pseudoalteromonas sp. MMG012]|uniref:hypothetical protein n=1 Tax=Pseudoalteromonas sp. MMG012 TaxID=2822686 RepID=UPI001B39DDE4